MSVIKIKLNISNFGLTGTTNSQTRKFMGGWKLPSSNTPLVIYEL